MRGPLPLVGPQASTCTGHRQRQGLPSCHMPVIKWYAYPARMRSAGHVRARFRAASVRLQAMAWRVLVLG
jgi:hypothetical protein